MMSHKSVNKINWSFPKFHTTIPLFIKTALSLGQFQTSLVHTLVTLDVKILYAPCIYCIIKFLNLHNYSLWFPFLPFGFSRFIDKVFLLPCSQLYYQHNSRVILSNQVQSLNIQTTVKPKFRENKLQSPINFWVWEEDNCKDDSWNCYLQKLAYLCTRYCNV